MPRDPEKVKARRKRYHQSEKGRAMYRKYDQSEKGKARKKKYQSTPESLERDRWRSRSRKKQQRIDSNAI